MTENATDRLPDDHLEVRDLSYDFTRTRQMYDLFKQSLFDPGFDSPGDAPPPDRLELYMKSRARGAGYVADFVYTSRDLRSGSTGSWSTAAAARRLLNSSSSN